MNGISLTELEALASACRKVIRSASAEDRGHAMSRFPHGSCGVACQLLGSLLFDAYGVRSDHVSAFGHPGLGFMQSHAWLTANGLVIDITHDQFANTGLDGWVFAGSPWHDAFQVRHRARFGVDNRHHAYGSRIYRLLRDEIVRNCQ